MTFQRTLWVVVLGAALISSLSMGIRQSFGLLLPPMTLDLGIGREAFAFAMALQQILWGIFQPLTGMVADRYGSARVLVVGTLVYAGGLLVMADAGSALALDVGAGLMVGFGTAATGFSVVLGAVGRLVSPEKRSMALGIATAGGSFGQFAMAPITQGLVDLQGWPGALVSIAVLSLLMAPFAVILMGRAVDGDGGPAQSLREAVAEASAHGGFRYLTLGFFVCGFHVLFVAVHLPAYLVDVGLPASTGALALALIGLFNIIGSYACGMLGGKYSKKWLLSWLYFARAIVFAVFLVAPKTETTVLLFASALGLLWLGTVPLTSGLVAQIFGVRYMATLFGIVFLSHQVGGFLGVWLGGYLYDATGSYDIIWISSIVLGIAAAIVHLPIDEKPVERQPAPA